MRGRYAIMMLAYVMALAVGVAVGAAVRDTGPIWAAWWGDAAATLAIFAFSFTFRNTSFYDAYWSVAPIVIATYWALFPVSPDVDPTRMTLALAMVTLWGVRLTYNWGRGWSSLDHEDWRYRNLQESMGLFYWPVSFFGLHFMPTVLVFLACLPVYVAVSAGSRPLGLLDGVALIVTLGAIAIEATADQQLDRFRKQQSESGTREVLRTGLWAWSRHPNYLGEISFWWGLYLFGLAAAPSYWWTGVGALSITLLFRFASLPMIETRMLERRPDFKAAQQEIPLLLPRRPRA